MGRLVESLDKLTDDELRDALVYTNYTENKIAKELRQYYALLPREDLLRKVPAELYQEDKKIPVTALEEKRRKAKEQLYKTMYMPIQSKHVDVCLKKKVQPSVYEKFVTEFMPYTWVKDVVEIAPSCMGVIITGNNFRAKCKKVKARILELNIPESVSVIFKRI